MKFDELDLGDDVLDALDAMKFETCTPIQERAIPSALQGRDIIAVAQTGTGKTAAYLLPIIDELSYGDYPQNAINCIVMAPTRELVQQIDQQLQGFSYFIPLTAIAVYGGTDGYTYDQQRRALNAGADIVVATPGRLLAHLSMGHIDLSKVSFFVLDEADRMLDMGFYDDIMQVAGRLPKERQTMLFSATMPPKIKQLAKTILHNPDEIRLSFSRPAEKIEQSAFVCYEAQKIPILEEVCSARKIGKAIVFASSKLKVKELTRALRKKKINVEEMHSDLDQAKREDVMLDFKAGKIQMLVATDILSRGIDIDDIDLVVNFDVPRECEDYVHRIGRTARADSDGAAITLVNDKDIHRFKKIEKFLGKEVRKEPLPKAIGEGPYYDRASGNKRSSNRGKSVRMRQSAKGNRSIASAAGHEDAGQKGLSDKNKGAAAKSHRRRRRGQKSGKSAVKPVPEQG